MPAARSTPEGVSQLLAFYNTIEGVRRAGGTRADAWGEINGLVGEGYLPPDASTIFDMNEVWQRAGAVINAEAGYARDLEAGALTGDGWAWAPWTTPTSADWQTSYFQVRYQYQVLAPDGTVGTYWGQTDWSDPNGMMPDLTDIQGQVNLSAQTSFDSYPSEFQQARGIAEGSSLGNIVSVQLLRT